MMHELMNLHSRMSFVSQLSFPSSILPKATQKEFHTTWRSDDAVIGDYVT
jgi:hypothetical protein